MPLTAAPWWYFSRGTVESDRDDPGVYEMGNASDSVIYIGSSDALRRRLKEHLSESGTCIRKNTVRYRIEYTKDYQARERQLYDQHVKIHGEPPQCKTASPSAGFSLRLDQSKQCPSVWRERGRGGREQCEQGEEERDRR